MDSHHFNVANRPANQQLLAWRERVGHVIDVLPDVSQTRAPFQGSIDRYQVGEYVFTDCTSDSMLLDRSIARISTDDQRAYVFHVFTRGGVETIRSFGDYQAATPGGAAIVAFDLGQPIRMKRSTCRVLTLFVPREKVEAAYPHAESMHGRVFERVTPMTRLAVELMVALGASLPDLDAATASSRIQHCAELLVAAFSRQAKLSGGARAAIRAAMFDRARRYIQQNLHQSTLTPDNVLQALRLKRPSLYRLFEHEGGLAAYIRNLRLREAAEELIKFPSLSVLEISYGLGFKSPSDFARAYRRRYGMSPQEMRHQALERLKTTAATSWKHK